MNENNNFPISEEQQEQLYREFRQRARLEDEAFEGDFEIPEEILEVLDNSTKSEFIQRFKKYQRSLPQYKRGKWTSAETINKCFHADLKRKNLDSFQVITNYYKHSDKLRTIGTAATEIYEELSSLIDSEDSFLTNAMEKVRRLAVFTFANAKFIDQDAKEIATKALHLPASVRHIGEEEETDKTLAFTPEIVEQVNKARFEQSLLRGKSRGFNNNYSRGVFNSRGRGFGFRGSARGGFRQLSGKQPFFGRGQYPHQSQPHYSNNQQQRVQPQPPQQQ